MAPYTREPVWFAFHTQPRYAPVLFSVDEDILKAKLRRYWNRFDDYRRRKERIPGAPLVGTKQEPVPVLQCLPPKFAKVGLPTISALFQFLAEGDFNLIFAWRSRRVRQTDIDRWPDNRLDLEFGREPSVEVVDPSTLPPEERDQIQGSQGYRTAFNTWYFNEYHRIEDPEDPFYFEEDRSAEDAERIAARIRILEYFDPVDEENEPTITPCTLPHHRGDNMHKDKFAACIYWLTRIRNLRYDLVARRLGDEKARMYDQLVSARDKWSPLGPMLLPASFKSRVKQTPSCPHDVQVDWTPTIFQCLETGALAIELKRWDLYQCAKRHLRVQLARIPLYPNQTQSIYLAVLYADRFLRDTEVESVLWHYCVLASTQLFSYRPFVDLIEEDERLGDKWRTILLLTLGNDSFLRSRARDATDYSTGYVQDPVEWLGPVIEPQGEDGEWIFDDLDEEETAGWG